MANEPTPRPPLPFAAEGEYSKALAGLETGVRPVSQKELASVKQLASLLGTQLQSELSIRGDIGGSAAGQNPIYSNRVRTPFILTCQKWILQQRYLIAAVNPSEVTWQLPQRAAAQKTRVGEIVHYWPDRFRGTFFDEPQLSITFQSGNIMPMRTKPFVQVKGHTRQHVYVPYFHQAKRRGEGTNFIQGQRSFDTVNEVKVPKLQPDPEETTPTIPPGLNNFYEFIELVDEQKILSNGEVNFVYIMYNSRIFPNMTLAGLFTPGQGLSWTDSANDPNQINAWTAGFTVYDSFPRLNDKAALIKMFEAAGWGRV